MLKGYRYAILALVGLLIGGTQPQKAGGAAVEKPAAEQTIKGRLPSALPPVIRTISADKPDAGCTPEQEDRHSDLCAQWKAADAAEGGAYAAWIFGILGSTIGSATLLAAIMAARYARDAAIETKRSADAADRALLQADTIARQQDRPWMIYDRMNIGVNAANNAYMMMPFWENAGSSPAIVTYMNTTYMIVDSADETPTFVRGEFHPLAGNGIVGPGKGGGVSRERDLAGVRPVFDGLRYLFINSRIEYTDVTRSLKAFTEVTFLCQPNVPWEHLLKVGGKDAFLFTSRGSQNSFH